MKVSKLSRTGRVERNAAATQDTVRRRIQDLKKQIAIQTAELKYLETCLPKVVRAPKINR